MKKIEQIIVVEGKNDSQKLKSFFDCDTIITQGTHLSKQTLEYIAKAQKQRGVIIFTDPDYPGIFIRNTINEKVKGCYNAFIDKKLARTSKKVGIEHAKKEDIEKALEGMIRAVDLQDTITKEMYIDLGLAGLPYSDQLRELLGNRLRIGYANAKTMLKRLNMLQISYQELEREVNECKKQLRP